MSHSGKPTPQIGFDSLAERFRGALSCENNKPDFKELDLGSPVSPLRTTRGSGGGSAAANGVATTSSSSSSSGSVSEKTGNYPVAKRSDGVGNNHSGELSGSSESSPTAIESIRSASAPRDSKLGHRRSNSCGAPLIYSGGSGSIGGGGSVNSPNVNVLPSGNICPSGKLLKTGWLIGALPGVMFWGRGQGTTATVV